MLCIDAAALHNNGDSLHQRQVCHPGAASEQAQNGGECERIRPAVLGGCAVLPEPSVFGDRAAEPPCRAGSASGSQPAGRAGSEGEEREEGDQSAEYSAFHQGRLSYECRGSRRCFQF